MIHKIFLSLVLVLFSACSFKTPQNQWQYKSAKAFESYKENFLSDNNTLAKSDLSRAISHAKQSADLEQLARIYLGECSLNISVGIQDNCQKYQELSTIINSKELDAYYKFISNATTDTQIKHLPNSYQEFAKALLQNDYPRANLELLKIQKTSSVLLATALLKENLNATSLKFALDTASFSGYKKAVLFHLKLSLQRAQNTNEKEVILKKIFILKN